MKRIRFVVILAIMLMVMASSAAAAPSVYLDGKQLAFQVPPVIENGRTLVPLRAIFEPLGATVQWNEATQTVTATKGSTVVVLTLGQSNAYVNNKAVVLAVPAKTIDGRTMVPLRFVGEALGCQVDWAEATSTISISSTKTGGSPAPNGLDKLQSDTQDLSKDLINSVGNPVQGVWDQFRNIGGNFLNP